MERFEELKKEKLVTYTDPVLAGLAGSIDAMLIMITKLESLEEWQRSIEFNSNPGYEEMVGDKDTFNEIINNIKFIMLERTMGFKLNMN